MYVDPNSLKCINCFKPTLRRLANFKAEDEFECYTENYVKCFWQLCDYHRSTENFTSKPKDQVIIQQPRRKNSRSKDIPRSELACKLTL